jgi:hypothetical protein
MNAVIESLTVEDVLSVVGGENGVVNGVRRIQGMAAQLQEPRLFAPRKVQRKDVDIEVGVKPGATQLREILNATPATVEMMDTSPVKPDPVIVIPTGTKERKPDPVYVIPKRKQPDPVIVIPRRKSPEPINVVRAGRQETPPRGHRGYKAGKRTAERGNHRRTPMRIGIQRTAEPVVEESKTEEIVRQDGSRGFTREPRYVVRETWREFREGQIVRRGEVSLFEY